MSTGPSEKLFGKWRGTCVNNVDPEQRGRIQATVPDVMQLALSSWAMPSVPVAGIQMGMVAVPPIGSGVWIEFEQGDPDFPIWTGCFWGTAAEVPSLSKIVPPAVPGITLQTPLQNGVVISDVPGPTGGIQLKSATGAVISITDAGITISNGKGAVITMVGNAVDVNGGALTVI